jgi:acylglycerol lipase
MTATSTSETVPARDGTDLLVRRWAPAGEPWATVLIVHGLGEHSGRWERVGARLAAAGIATAGYDHLGHGASGGKRAHVDRWSDLLDDAEDRLTASRLAGVPAVLYGQSMGGLVCADYLFSDRPAPDVAVLSAPALGDRTNPVLRALAPVLGSIAPTLAIANPFAPAQLSRDPSVGEAYAADPLTTSKTTLRLAKGIFAAADRVNARLAAGATLPCPTLVIHGEDDPIIPAWSTEPLAAAGATRRTLPDVLHEPHNDTDGPAIVDDIVAWLRMTVTAGR